MEVLTGISTAVVIATYIDPPILPGLLESSGLCRYPMIIRPRLDIDQVMKAVPELEFLPKCNSNGNFNAPSGDEG